MAKKQNESLEPQLLKNRKLTTKIKLALNQFTMDHPSTRKVIWNAMNEAGKIHYNVDTFGVKTDPKTVVFCSFAGQSYSDSPRAIYEAMAKDPRFDDYKFVWVFKTKRKCNKFIRYFLNRDPRVKVVQYGSRTWRRLCAKAKYWIYNFKIADSIFPKKDQIFVQTWHGTPLKRLGFDLEHFDIGTAGNMEEMIKRYGIEASKFDYFVSPSEYTTEKILSAWNLKAYGLEGIVHETGYPRNDFLTNYTQKDVRRSKIDNIGYWFYQYEKAVKKKKIILYAPTYRPNQYALGSGYEYKEEIDFDKLRERLGEDYIILFRAHYLVANAFDFAKYEGFVYNASRVEDINALYIISDILITDYSSSCFDFSILKRPMIFYMYDLEHYRDESNGFYFDVNELPGPIVRTDDEVIDEILKLPENYEIDDKYQAFMDKFVYREDGHSSERVIEDIFFSDLFKDK